MSVRMKVDKLYRYVLAGLLSILSMILIGPSQQTLAQQLPFLVSPYYGTKTLTAFVDHEYPYIGANNIFTRYDGQRWTSGASVSNCTLTINCYDNHEGTDFDLNYEPVLAAAGGTVQMARWQNTRDRQDGLGLYVEIDHGNGYMTRYGHLSAIAVEVNNIVVAGQIIGTSGNTGNSTGSHLHFEVLHNGIFVDPFGWSGSGSDPWALHAEGATSHCLWADGEWTAVCGGVKRPLPAPPRGRVITIDDGDPNFRTGTGGREANTTCNPPNDPACPYWYQQTGTVDDSGQNGDSFYTYDEEQADYWAEWQLNISEETQGWYDIEVFVPRNRTDSWHVPYHISSASGSPTAHLDQYDSQPASDNDGWINLGAYRLTQGLDEVRMTDGTGENHDRALAADAVRFTHLATYLPDVRSAHQGWDTALHIRNDGAGPTDIVITLFNPNGTHFHRDVIANVQPRARLYYNPTRNNWRGSIIVSAREAVSVLVAHQHLHPYKVGAYTGVTAPTPRGHVSLLLRNVYGLNSTLALLNTGDTETRLTVRFSPRQKENGNPEGQACTEIYTVQASGTQNINLSDLTCLGDLFVGSAYITNSANHPLAIASTQESAKTLNAMSNLYSGNTLYAPLVQYGQPGSWDIFSSASVQNTSDSLGQISTYYYNVDGSQCTGNNGNPWTYAEIAGHHMVNIIPLPPDGNGCQNSVVAAKVIGGAQTWTAWVNQRENFATSTYEAVGQGSRAISIPYWHNTGTWDTGLSLQNLANVATTVTIVFYNPDGTEHSTHTVSLEPEGRFTYGWDEPDPDFSGSAFVTANNPIAAVVNVLDYHYKEREVDSLISYTPIHYYLD